MKYRGPNVFIEFDIILNSDADTLKKELDILIRAGRLIFVWSKTVKIQSMLQWVTQHELNDYIWGYRVKDSSHYQSPDFIIDNDERFVKRFERQGIPGNVVDRL